MVFKEMNRDDCLVMQLVAMIMMMVPVLLDYPEGATRTVVSDFV